MIPTAFFRNIWLAAGLLIALFVVGMEAPVWIRFFATALVTVRLMIDFQIMKPIPKWATYTIVIALFIEVLVQFRSIFDQDSATTMLIGLCALKILDFETKRDIKFLFILGLLVLSLKPLYSLELNWIPPLFIAFFCLWMGLMGVLQRPQWKILFRLSLQSLPVAALLFLIFPRVIVPWAQKKTNVQAVVGFSDQMDPASTPSIASRSGLAFRAHFDGQPNILSKDLYWRGAVLQKTSGLKWDAIPFKSNVRKIIKSPTLAGPLAPLSYQVLLEPDNQSYLFALEHPYNLSSNSLRILSSNLLTYQSNSDHSQSLVYEGRSNIYEPEYDEPTPADLQVPEKNMNIDGFVEHLREKNDPSEALAELDRFFSDKSFTYTLSRGVYQDGTLTEFLFRRKKGFCQHYAGAYATIARLLRIPSRVVLGYQGGTYNPAGDFWEISAKDAHAWVEVYIHGKWTRKDPTGLVAPLRLELGANEFFNLPEDERKLFTQEMIQHKAQYLWLAWEDEASAWWSNLNYKWTMFLLDYNTSDSQKIFVELLRSSWKWILTFGFIFWMLSRGLKWRVGNRQASPLSQKIMRDLLALPKSAKLHHTPLQRLGESKPLPPETQQFLEQLSATYEAQVYRRVTVSIETERQLRREWRRHRREIRRAFDEKSAS